MAKTYDRAPQKIVDRVAAMMKKFHDPLFKAGVVIDCLIACNDKGPGVTLRGRKCYAVVRRTSLSERAAGRGDAEIVFDGNDWQDWPPAQLDAICDHELAHLEYADKTDDLGRPKLNLIPHDVEFGWFIAVAERHGEASIEQQQAANIAAKYTQALFPFMYEAAKAKPATAVAKSPPKPPTPPAGDGRDFFPTN